VGVRRLDRHDGRTAPPRRGRPRGWRGLFVAAAACALALTALVARFPEGRQAGPHGAGWPGIRDGLGEALRALRRWRVVRWLALLQLADLVLDVFFGYLALYLVDVAGLPPALAATGVVLWTVAGLAGDFLVIPLLEKVRPLKYLRLSAAATAIAFPAFLLANPPVVKLALVVALGIGKSGWYPILKARLYASMPDRPGAAMAVSNIAGLAGGLVPLALGAVAEAAGLCDAMWILLAGPVAVLVMLPRKGVDDP
jgi:MFS transporter, FSR family, fosmidomycin resistance protein